MAETLKEMIVGNWQWHVRDPALLRPWFKLPMNGACGTSVKSGKQRDVFKVESECGTLFVKHNHPVSLSSKAHSVFNPKAKSEYESALILEKHGIPVVDMAGWAENGTESILLSMELNGAVNSRDFWFGAAAHSARKRGEFLSSISRLIAKFISSGICHNDLHLGNLLLTEGDMEFHVVDAYGIYRPLFMRKSQVFSLLKLAGSMRGELSDAEAQDFLSKCIPAAYFPKAGDLAGLWQRILRHEALESEKGWGKHRRRILSDSDKNVSKAVIDGTSFLIKRDICGAILIGEEDLRRAINGDPGYEARTLPAPQALDIWLSSFRLDCHRIRHRSPVAFARTGEGQDVLVFRKLEILSGEDRAMKDEFIRRCVSSGLEEDGLETATVMSPSGFLLRDFTGSLFAFSSKQ